MCSVLTFIWTSSFSTRSHRHLPASLTLGHCIGGFKKRHWLHRTSRACSRPPRSKWPSSAGGPVGNMSGASALAKIWPFSYPPLTQQLFTQDHEDFCSTGAILLITGFLFDRHEWLIYRHQHSEVLTFVEGDFTSFMGKIPVNENKKASKPAWLLAFRRFQSVEKSGRFFPPSRISRLDISTRACSTRHLAKRCAEYISRTTACPYR